MTSRKAPWKKGNPRKKAGKTSKTISPAKKSAAKKRAKKAGRSYPNLVDNMWAASRTKKSKTKAAKKSGSKKAVKRKTPNKTKARKTSAKRSRKSA